MSRGGHAPIVGSYQDALRVLQTRSRIARPTTPSGDPSNGSLRVASDVKGTPSLHGMHGWLKMLGHTDQDLKALNVVHVAGTKGKGSTCAFIETLLRTHGHRTGFPIRTGLYTSPHLICPEERIRLNHKPISQDAFARSFFEVYQGLKRLCDPHEFASRPRHLQLWALTAFHTFIKEKVQVAVIETHHGGEFDATNFVKEPVVTVITSLGMDHVQQLGPTISDIAWHKAGIFKHNAIAVSAPQPVEAAAVLERRAIEKDIELILAGKNDDRPQLSDLSPDAYRTNCDVAITAANAFLQRTSKQHSRLSDTDITIGIRDFTWPGRFHRVTTGSTNWFLDSAHNEMSVDIAAQWFQESVIKLPRLSAQNTLLFSHMSHVRDWEPLLRKLLTVLTGEQMRISTVMFTSYQHTHDSDEHRAENLDESTFVELSMRFGKVFEEYYPLAKVCSEQYIDRAAHKVSTMTNTERGSNIFVTGSQKLVGGVLKYLQTLDPP